MIPLMKNAFIHEVETKKALAGFIETAPRLSMDTCCQRFEETFGTYQRRRDAVLFNSGGSSNLALIQSLKNVGYVKDCDNVGFSAVTWSTNVMPILQMGLHPVPVDCNPRTLNSMSEDLLACLDRVALRVFFITNALGLAGDLKKIHDICEQEDIILIEDNCEALGTTLPEGRAGNFGLASTFSFFIAHHMSTIEGGMVCTDDKELGEMLRIVRANGWDRNLTIDEQKRWRDQHNITSEFEAKYSFYDLAYNLRPTEITGFLGLFQMKYLDDSIRTREKNFHRLMENYNRNDEFLPYDYSHLSCVSNFAFPIMCRSPTLRQKYIQRFSDAGVEVRPMIAGNIQHQPFYKKYISETFALPGADLIHRCGFYCGNSPDYSDSDLEVIISCLRKH